MGETEIIPSIEPLTEENYDTWKEEVQEYMEKKHLWEYIKETPLSSEKLQPLIKEDAPEAEKDLTWKQNDKKAREELIKLIHSSDLLSEVENCATSHDIWVKLEKIYNLKCQARKATLLEKLMVHPVMTEDADFEITLEDFFVIVDELVAMGVEIEKKLLITTLLHILPPSFEKFKRSVLSSDKWPELKDLIQEILEYSEDRNEDGKKDDTELVQNPEPVNDDFSEQQKFMLDKFAAELRRYTDLQLQCKETFDEPISIDRRTEPTVEKKIRCGICGTEGHNSSMCLHKISNESLGSCKKSYKCGICKKEGHNRTTCNENSFQETRSSTGSLSALVKRVQKCGICGNEGHNRTTCSQKSFEEKLVSGSTKKSRKCGICGNEGHNSTTCIRNISKDTSGEVRKTVTCGLCGKEGHNRTTCIQSSDRLSTASSGSSPRTVHCGLCGEEGHNRTTCSRNSDKQSITSSASSPRTVHCGLCGEEGHNRTTCSRNSDKQSITSSVSQKTIHCGLCGQEGHNRTTCSRNSFSPSVLVASTPKRTITCGNCGVQGHNRSTCTMNTTPRASYTPLYSGYSGSSYGYGGYSSPSPASSSSGSRSYRCGKCGGSGHNRRTCNY